MRRQTKTRPKKVYFWTSEDAQVIFVREDTIQSGNYLFLHSFLILMVWMGCTIITNGRQSLSVIGVITDGQTLRTVHDGGYLIR